MKEQKEYKGHNGDLILTDSGVIIKRGAKGFLLGGGLLRGDKTIPYSSIVSVQFKKAGMVQGYIQLTLKGGNEAKSGWMESLSDENTINFNVWGESNTLFLEAKKEIENRISGGGQKNISNLDELENNEEQKQKGYSVKLGIFLKRNWKLVLVLLVIFYAIGLAGELERKDRINTLLDLENTDKKVENKAEEVKEPESKPEEGNREPVKLNTEEKRKETTSPVVEKKAESPASAPTLENKQTVSQKGAIQTAENYLRIKGFSRSGLIEQLKFEQFSEADATYAVDNIKIDYNEQAKKSAESYMSIKGFSRGGLIYQLKFEGFTQSQAEYGADSVGL